MTFISLSSIAKGSFGSAKRLVGFHSTDVGSIMKDFHFTCAERKKKKLACENHLCGLLFASGTASVGGLKMHFITSGSRENHSVG